MPGLSLGIGMANREFVCILCKRNFSRMMGDLIIVEESICDECLEELSQLDEKALRAHVPQRLAEQGLRDQEIADRIIQAIPDLLARKRRLEELISRTQVSARNLGSTGKKEA
jgi:hypothetical protein